MPCWLNILLWGVTIALTHATAFYMGKTFAYREMTRRSLREREELVTRISKLLEERKK